MSRGSPCTSRSFLPGGAHGGFAVFARLFSLALLWAAYQFRIRQLQRESRQLRDVIETIPAHGVDRSARRLHRFREQALGWSIQRLIAGAGTGFGLARRPFTPTIVRNS